MKNKIILFLVSSFFSLITNAQVDANNSYDAVKCLPSESKIDGSVDYTNFLQSCINDYDNLILPNFPILINANGLKLRSNTKLVFQENSSLVLAPTDQESYAMLDLNNVENIRIINPKLIGDRTTHLGTTGEHGMGISINSSKNIFITGGNISNCWGDGIYLGNLKLYDKTGNFVTNTNIIIDQIVLNNNRRNALSLITGVDILLKNITASNTNGTAPMAGIDIEPNNNKNMLENINLENITTINNRYGIQIVLKKMVGVKSKNVSININNHIDKKSKIAMRFDKFDREGLKLNGQVLISNAKWIDSKNTALDFNGSQYMSPKIIFDNVEIIKSGKVSYLKELGLEEENVIFN